MKIGLKCCLTGVLMVFLFVWAAFERTTWDEDFVIEDGSLGAAHFRTISWRHLINTHVMSIGGGRISSAATFNLDEHRSHWESKREERIFVVQFSQQQWYAISLDRTDGHRWVIRFYKGKDGGVMREIESNEYPIKLAIQNLWLTDEMVRVNSTFISDNIHASFSFLAKAWWKVIHGEDVKEVELQFIKKVAAREFPGRLSFLPPQPRKHK